MSASTTADSTGADATGREARGESTTVVRALGSHEWPLYRLLRLRSLGDAPHAFGSTLDAEMARSDADWAWRLHLAAQSGRELALMAEVGAVPAGLVRVKDDHAEPGVVNLYEMWVVPEARGLGVAAKLLDMAIGWARARHGRIVQLGVVDNNGAARRLYERAGFVPFGMSLPLRPGDPRLEQRMRLQLGAGAPTVGVQLASRVSNKTR